MGHLLLTVKRVARAGLNNGYRVVINTSNDGGQTVNHLHLHIFGRRQTWPQADSKENKSLRMKMLPMEIYKSK